MDMSQRRAYWRANLRLMTGLLIVWALASYGAGILFAEQLDRISFLGVPLGFWMAQQGSILVFLLLIAIYVWRMDQLDKKFGVDEYEEEVHHS